MKRTWKRQLLALLLLASYGAYETRGQEKTKSEKATLRPEYTRREYRIPMRDGVKLFTVVFTPSDASGRYPILMVRTPYNAGQRVRLSGKSSPLAGSGYIFALQDVRGCFQSEGTFINMRPHIEKKTSKSDCDESSDTYDTIDWLLANIPNHNGKVGQAGVSYDGFNALAGMIDAHPALKAVSPQGSNSDWWYDDIHHHGAFFLPHAFNFFSYFGVPRAGLTTAFAPFFEYGTKDGYQFYLDLGPLKNANERHLKNKVPFWNEICQHPNYDRFWQERSIVPHLRKVASAVMTVGGWFDGEALYGPLKTYASIGKHNPGVRNFIVMGPWYHTGWSVPGVTDSVADIHFGSQVGNFKEEIEKPFFEYFLKNKGQFDLPQAYMFETGANRWRKFPCWPPPKLERKSLYFREGGRLSFSEPESEDDAYDSYVSDPSRPVPYTETIETWFDESYMVDDQRFASRRPDVLSYQTEVLKEDITFAGELLADLQVSTSGTDSDWIVKIIDVFPADAADYPNMPRGRHMSGYQMLVRGEVIRGRFRNSDEHPEPFVPDQPTVVKLVLQDLLHTFKKGHRIMVQIQGSWFPMVDRNPQKYVDNIYLHAEERDFIKATQRVFRSKRQPSSLQVGVLLGGRR